MYFCGNPECPGHVNDTFICDFDADIPRENEVSVEEFKNRIPTKCRICKRDFEVGETIIVKMNGVLEGVCDPCDNDAWHSDPAGDTYNESRKGSKTMVFGGV